MTDPERERIEALIADLKAACVGHPNARIRCPHRLLHEAIEQLRADHPAGAVQRPAPDDEWVASFWKVVCENNRKLEALMAEYRIERGDPPLADHPAQVGATPAEQPDGRLYATPDAWLHAADRAEQGGGGAMAAASRPGATKMDIGIAGPSLVEQSKAVERAAARIKPLPGTPYTDRIFGESEHAALSAAATTLAAVPGVMSAAEALLNTRAPDQPFGWGFAEAEALRAALRVLAGDTKGK